MARSYDHTPANFLHKSKHWYRLARDDYDRSGGKFGTVQYVAFCFSLEFLLKALICLDKNNAVASVIRTQGHKLGLMKNKALSVVRNQHLKQSLVNFFEIYSELERIDVVKIRYGELGSVTTYSLGMFEGDGYMELLNEVEKVIKDEWTWMRWTSV
jgi:hypothetical protein